MQLVDFVQITLCCETKDSEMNIIKLNDSRSDSGKGEDLSEGYHGDELIVFGWIWSKWTLSPSFHYLKAASVLSRRG